MARKKASIPPKNDFAPEEDLDVSGFTSEPVITGECITSFSFHDSSENIISEKHDSNTSSATADNTIDLNISSNSKDNASTTSSSDNNILINNNVSLNDKDTLTDNRKAPIANGMAPPINGEYPNVKRTYILRASTVRKINELKSIHPEINTYVSTIVDIAIAHYYNHIINEGGTQ
jgi:hypothetical protein